MQLLHSEIKCSKIKSRKFVLERGKKFHKHLHLFIQNDDAPVNLMEMRFHIPASELSGDDPVDSFHKQVMKNASVISVSGDAIAIFREIPCLTPR